MGQRLHSLDGFWNIPNLVGIDHQRDIRADHRTCYAEPTLIIFRISTDLKFDMPIALLNRFAAEPFELLVRITQPPGGCRITLKTIRLQVGDPLLSMLTLLLKHGDGLISGQHIREIAQIQVSDECDWLHITDELPEREARSTRRQVPYRIHYSGTSQVDNAFIRAEPAKLRICSEFTVGFSGVIAQLSHIAANKAIR